MGWDVLAETENSRIYGFVSEYLAGISLVCSAYSGAPGRSTNVLHKPDRQWRANHTGLTSVSWSNLANTQFMKRITPKSNSVLLNQNTTKLCKVTEISRKKNLILFPSTTTIKKYNHGKKTVKIFLEGITRHHVETNLRNNNKNSLR